MPALVIHGTAGEMARRPNARAIYDRLTSAPKREIIWVEGASHYLTPGWIAETYAKRIAEWGSKNTPLTNQAFGLDKALGPVAMAMLGARAPSRGPSSARPS